MSQDREPQRRLLALWDHLGLTAAHVATQMPADIAGLARTAPERLGHIVLSVPARLDPAPFAAMADRVVMIAGETGPTAAATAHALRLLPAASRIVLPGYHATGWADVVADRTADVIDILATLPPLPPLALPPTTGAYAGIRYAITGQGPPLVLLPFFLAASQWEPAIPALAERFTVIVLGGRHLGGVAALEDRAAGASYQAMARTLWDRMQIEADDVVLDVGCGSGALDRLLAPRLTQGRIVATDLNRFLLREAAALSGGHENIAFQQANAESLPFADASFDAAFTITVLEECDADRALRELHRVVRPGGRVGVVVRAIDMPQWWHLELPPDLRRKAEVPPQSVAPAGVADASLYRRMQQAGFHDVTGCPALVTFDSPDGPIWHYREDHLMAQFTDDEAADWRRATEAARADGLLFMANPLHCAVGTKTVATKAVGTKRAGTKPVGIKPAGTQQGGSEC